MAQRAVSLISTYLGTTQFTLPNIQDFYARLLALSLPLLCFKNKHEVKIAGGVAISMNFSVSKIPNFHTGHCDKVALILLCRPRYLGVD